MWPALIVHCLEDTIICAYNREKVDSGAVKSLKMSIDFVYMDTDLPFLLWQPAWLAACVMSYLGTHSTWLGLSCDFVQTGCKASSPSKHSEGEQLMLTVCNANVKIWWHLKRAKPLNCDYIKTMKKLNLYDKVWGIVTDSIKLMKNEWIFKCVQM